MGHPVGEKEEQERRARKKSKKEEQERRAENKVKRC